MSSSNDAPLAPKDALLGVLVGAIHADARVRSVEVREAELHARGVPALDIAPKDVTARLPAVKATVAQMGEVEFLDACVRALDPELRVRAFRAVADIIVADRELAPAEERYLSRLATAFAVQR